MPGPRPSKPAILLAAACAIALAACNPIERTPRPPQSRRADLGVDVPRILQGTIASEAVIEGFQPVVVHGYGLVVGLDGTGSADVPPDVRGHMIATAAHHGIGSERRGYGALSPESLIDSNDTAIVVVEGVIPPGAPAGQRFDVRVFAHPTSSTISLEGGRLYTTELVPVNRPDLGRRMLPPTGSRQPAVLATAAGPVFINPFADPGAVDRDSVDRRTGMILNGGRVAEDMPLKLRLFTPSHTRAAVIQNALNTRYPQEPGQRDPTARGENDESIVVTVPRSYHDDTDEFVQLLRYTTIRQAGAQSVAMTVRRYVMENPSEARAASWRWYALGERCLPVIRDLYDEPQELPRLAALRAGASLKDPLVTPDLIEMAESASPDSRAQAITLLGEMGVDPRIDECLRRLVNDRDVEVRLEAYEALAKRRDPSITRIPVQDKFVIDVVDPPARRPGADEPPPMIYITQFGLPRVVIFDADLSISRPVTMTAWSQRFMVKGEADDRTVEVYYRPPDALQGTTRRTEARLVDFVRFLARSAMPEDPEPGLDLTYSQVVGVLHQIWRQGYLDADFKPEQDRILAAILRQQRRGLVTDRPEFEDSSLESQEPPAAEDAPVLPEAGTGWELEELPPGPDPSG